MCIFSERVIMSLVLVIFSFGIALSPVEGAAAEQTEDSATAEHILKQAADIYGTCKSYCDSGVVKTIFFMKDRERVDEKPFTTAFVRPNRFRFEYSSKFPVAEAKSVRHIIWANGEDVRTWWDIQPGVKEGDTLPMALAGATGVSGGAAHTTAVLLMPEAIKGMNVVELQQPTRIADALLDDVACYCIEGNLKVPGTKPITLWIGKKTHLIHRIDSKNTFPEFRTETTTTYKPEVDVTIDESKLAFNAPEKEPK